MQTHNERVQAAIKDFKEGKMVILTDHPDREDEGDFIMPAETIATYTMNVMIRNGTGVVCGSISRDLATRFDLLLMLNPADKLTVRAPFTTSIDAKEGITTGVSAADRTITVQTLMRD